MLLSTANNKVYTVYETRSVYMTYSNKQRHQNIKVNSTSTK